MSVIVIDEILDPIGNNSMHKYVPVVYWQYVNMNRKYGVQINWFTPESEKSMYHTLDMHCIGMKDTKATWEITKDNFYIDNKKPEDHISLLAIESAAAYYPFEFMAAKDGQVHNVINTDKLQKRFAQIKPILLRNYEGDIAVEYINAVENVLHNAEQLKSIVTKDILLSLFFAPIIGEYDPETKAKEVMIEFPFIGFEDPFVFKGTAAISSKTKDTNIILFQGTLLQPVAVEDIMPLDGKILIRYDLDVERYRIRNIMCDAIINTEQGKYSINVNGYKITEKQIIKVKEEKPKPEPVGWMAFFRKD
jgi:hypothetical protein